MRPVSLLRSVSYLELSVITLANLNQAPVTDLSLPTFNRSVAAITWRNILHTFGVQAGTHNLFTKYFGLDTQISHAWVNVGGNFTSDPIPIALDSGELIVLGRFSDDAIWYQTFNRELFYSRNVP